MRNYVCTPSLLVLQKSLITYDHSILTYTQYPVWSHKTLHNHDINYLHTQPVLGLAVGFSKKTIHVMMSLKPKTTNNLLNSTKA